MDKKRIRIVTPYRRRRVRLQAGHPLRDHPGGARRPGAEAAGQGRHDPAADLPAPGRPAHDEPAGPSGGDARRPAGGAGPRRDHAHEPAGGVRRADGDVGAADVRRAQPADAAPADGARPAPRRGRPRPGRGAGPAGVRVGDRRAGRGAGHGSDRVPHPERAGGPSRDGPAFQRPPAGRVHARRGAAVRLGAPAGAAREPAGRPVAGRLRDGGRRAHAVPAAEQGHACG